MAVSGDAMRCWRCRAHHCAALRAGACPFSVWTSPSAAEAKTVTAVLRAGEHVFFGVQDKLAAAGKGGAQLWQ